MTSNQIQTPENGAVANNQHNGRRKQTILIVDDMMINRSMLMDMLGRENYNFLEAEDGSDAIALLKEHGINISLVLLDLMMEGVDGIEVLENMEKNGWLEQIPVIMISATTKSEDIEKVLEYGVTDFINRPFDINIVQRRVTNTLTLYANQEKLSGIIEDEVKKRERNSSMMVSVLSQIVEFRNGDSARHVFNVNSLTEMFLKQIARKKKDEYPLSSEDIRTIKVASSLHDIGKISIPENILNKPGRLTEEEFETMKTHSAIGAEMLKSIPAVQNDPIISVAHDICRWHHERWDGRGYPDGLVGNDIPISAQVVALADVYDALTSKRVYKDAYPHEEAIEMIMSGACGQFNPFLLEVLDEVKDDIPEMLEVAEKTEESFEFRELMNQNSKTNISNRPSDRTLELLDYERMKYDFYAQMSNEIQFDYNIDPPMVMFHDYSENKIGVDEIIPNPKTDKKLISIFGEENLQRFGEEISKTTIENPIFQFDLEGTVNGEARWFHLDARANWVERNGKSEPVLESVIGKLIDIHESHARLMHLEREATTDSLTGLMNHSCARKLISARMRENPEQSFVMMVLDMDHFKQANDNNGHLFGDEVLKHLAGKLKDSVRTEDIVSRVGGDEFLVCMMVDDVSKPLVSRIYNSLLGEHDGFPISISMGVEVAAGNEFTYDELFKRADEALYTMKKNGRGGFMYRSETDYDGGEDDAASVISTIESNQAESDR